MAERLLSEIERRHSLPHPSPREIPAVIIDRFLTAYLPETRDGEIGLLRDLQDLHVLASLVQTTWTVIAQGAQGLRDRDLLDLAQHANGQTSRQLTWLNTRMKTAAPQALIVAP